MVIADVHYLHWGVIQISLANLLVIVAMVVLFVAALVIPFPGARKHSEPEVDSIKERSDDRDQP